MRTTAVVFVFVLGLLVSGPAAAQEWETFASPENGFEVLFPGKPRVTETTWTSQQSYLLPAKVYSAERGRERYSLTVVDYSSLEQQGIERAKTCPPGNANCRNAGGVIGPGYWRNDYRGAVVYAAWKLTQRDVDLTLLLSEWQDMVEGLVVQMTHRSDKSRVNAYVAMHKNKLLILEGTVPAGYPEPGLFQQSLGYIDEKGNGVRYQGIVYSHAYHGLGHYPVPPSGAGAAGAGAGAGGGAAAPAPAGN